MLRSSMIPVALLAGLLCGGCRTPAPTFNPFAGYGSPRVSAPATGSYGTPNTYYPNSAAPVGAGTQSPAVNSGFQPAALGTTPTAMLGNGWKPLGSRSAPGNVSNGHLLAMPNPPQAVSPATYTASATGIAGQTAVQQASVGSGIAQPAAAPAAAVYAAPAGTAATLPTASATPQLQQPASATQSFLRLKPMPVNDATTGNQPGRFVPAASAARISPQANQVRPALSGSNNIRGFPQTVRGNTAQSVSVATQSNPAVAGAAGVRATSATIPQPTPASTGQTSATVAASGSAPSGWRQKFSSTTGTATVVR